MWLSDATSCCLQEPARIRSLRAVVTAQAALPHPAAHLPLACSVDSILSGRAPAKQFSSQLQQLLFPNTPLPPAKWM